ncbi:MAG: hypothetical protein HY281_08725 [Nitrospirae bacterium]|nr:hypothetical protein [Nitrospirota bacterium]
MRKRGGDKICQVCLWHDDGQDDLNADEVWGGPNYELSLTEARQNFRAFEACCRRVLLTFASLHRRRHECVSRAVA